LILGKRPNLEERRSRRLTNLGEQNIWKIFNLNRLF